MKKRQSVIPTPWKVRFQRFSRSTLPLIILVATAFLVVRLWAQQAASAVALGRVDVTRVNITAGSDGVLMPLGSQMLRSFQPVQKGQIVARLDDRALQSQVAALRADVETFRGELMSTEVDALGTDAERRHDALRLAAELASEVERCRLEIVDRNSQIKEVRLELARTDTQLQYLQVGTTVGMATLAQSAPIQKEREALQQLLQAHELALEKAQENYHAAVARRNSHTQFEPTEVASVLAPIRASITAAEERVREVEAMIENLVIRSPVTGTISDIYFHEGQGVRAGEWIMTITEDASAQIVAYLSPQAQLQLEPGMPATVNRRTSREQGFRTAVQDVAPYWAPIPLELMRDQNIPELALAVRLPIPDKVHLRPGELVQVRFHRQSP
jgi:multidrug resistance efflux pump